ncbi:MAG: TrmB family transcriptional regulator [Candidatus Fermentibacteraceae bacterium]|nr:TrmB family transcriptional regulator [Candidatus Fermentibacteraceae bacterium]
MKKDIIDHLEELGFSGFEAEVYLALVREPGVTGYRAARIIGKPVPNTYKTLDGMEAAGAVMVDDSGRSRLYSAVPIDDYVDLKVRGLKQSGKSAKKCLDNLGKSPPEEGVYRLSTVHQVYQKAENIIRSAETSLLVDIDPIPLEKLRRIIEEAAGRGVKVLAHVHSDTMDWTIPGCEVVNSCKLDWPGEWVTVQADARDYLIGIITADQRRVFQAVWSRNPFIAPCIYQGYMNRAVLYRIMLMFGAGRSSDEIRTEMLRLWNECGVDDPGTGALHRLLRDL